MYGSNYGDDGDYFDEILWLDDSKELYDAIMKDIEAGRMKISSLKELRVSPPIEVYFDLVVPRSERNTRRYTEPGTVRIHITKDMTEALKVIEKHSGKSYEDLINMYEEHYGTYEEDVFSIYTAE